MSAALSDAVDVSDVSPVLRVSEAAKLLGVCDDVMYGMLRRGAISYLRLGRVYRIPRAEIDRIIREGLQLKGGAGRPAVRLPGQSGTV